MMGLHLIVEVLKYNGSAIVNSIALFTSHFSEVYVTIVICLLCKSPDCKPRRPPVSVLVK